MNIRAIGLDRLKIFYFVVREKSFKTASAFLGLSAANVSWHISSLEKEMGAHLINRGDTSLTEEGKILYDFSKKMFEDFQEAQRKIESLRGDDNKTMRIITTFGTSGLKFVETIAVIHDQFPQLNFIIEPTENEIILINTIADASIDLHKTDHHDIENVHLGSVHARLFASKTYLEKYGTPKTTEDLDHHRLISYYTTQDKERGNVDWHLTIGKKKKDLPRIPFIAINSGTGQLLAAKNNLGIVCIVAELPMVEEANLVTVLPDLIEETNIYYTYKKDRAKYVPLREIGDILKNYPFL